MRRRVGGHGNLTGRTSHLPGAGDSPGQERSEKETCRLDGRHPLIILSARLGCQHGRSARARLPAIRS
ncbi:hypothetical protein OCAR_4653 [Afipia carboxidovorans OM5]|nr:hypothetical protein OCAR_4653 [Afipia carboxidovorans OM5]